MEPIEMLPRRLPMRRRRGGVAAAASAVIALGLVSGCFMEEAPNPGIDITNDTAQSVRVSYVVDGVERSDAGDVQGDTLVPRQSKVFYFDIRVGFTPITSPGPTPKRCTHGDIVIRALDGTLVGRIPPPVCEPYFLLISKDASTPAPS